MHLTRRDLIALIGAGIALRPLPAATVPARMPTIGVLVIGSPGSENFWRLFREAMRKLGYVDGKTVHYVFRSDQGDLSRLPGLAVELVQLKVDLIVAWFTPAALAARHATRDIPIVMALVGDPVENGLADSLAHPGGNVTGMAAIGAELAGKDVDFVRELVPSTSRIAALANVLDPFYKPFLGRIRANGATSGIAIEPVLIHQPEELDAAFAAMANHSPAAVIVQPSLPMKRVADLAIRYRIPAVSFIREFAEAGGVMSYGSDEADAYRKAAVYVDKILKGVAPPDLPVQEPTKFELVINLKAAAAIGLAVPQSLFSRADDLIQ
jgi:putative ABC transport system substrate-binding protein